MRTVSDTIRSIICDLDGTLYASPGLARDIDAAAAALVGASRGGGPVEGRVLIEGARSRLTELDEREPTLSRICQELGIELADLHRALQNKVRPERHLTNDPVLCALLDSLRGQCDLYIYTNNSFPLAQRILSLLGIEDLFQRVYSIEFCWRPKPDPEALHKVLEDIGGPLESFLFIGDREQIDLTTPAELGIRTLLVRETADLLMIHRLLGIVP